MALIRCPQCGQQISDKAAVCPHCGKKKQMNKKLWIFAGCGILAILILSGILIVSANSFSAEEEYGLKIVDKYQDILKNPDSLILRSDVAVISYIRDGTTYKYVFFDASGENSYGASVKSTPCFVNGQYLCDSDEIPTIEEYMSMSDAEAREYLGLELALAHWRLYGEDAKEQEDVVASYSVDGEKIAKKLKIKETID